MRSSTSSARARAAGAAPRRRAEAAAAQRDQGAGRRSRRAAPASRPAARGSVIQLGAFKNAAQAERAWTALVDAASRAIAAMNKLVVPFSGGFRLRAGGRFAGRSAGRRARRCKAAGENCFVAQ